MSQPRRGNRTLIKAMNRNLILNIVRQQGPLSRTQLTELSGLSVGSVSQITNEMLDEGWLLGAGESESTGGRPQSLIRLNPRRGSVIGLKLMEDRVSCAVTDLEASVYHHLERSLNYDHSPESIAEALADVARQAMVEADLSRSDVLGVGIGLAGIVDSERGMVRYSPYFHWRNVALADYVAQRLKLPVYLENDVNTLTIEEQLFGDGHEIANFAVVTIGRGIGMGLVIDHQLYQGIPGGAGELGHLTLEMDGARCDCGKQGCLEAIAADPAVLRDLEAALAEGSPSSLQSPLSFEQVVSAARYGDALAQHALARSGRYLGLGLSMLINLLHPNLLVISGEGISAGDYRLQPMRAALHSYTMNGLLEDVTIIIKPMDDQTWARGAACVVLGQIFASPLLREYALES